MKINMNTPVTVTLNPAGRTAFLAYVNEEAGSDAMFDDMLDEYDYDVDTEVLTLPLFELVNIFGTGDPDQDHRVYFESNSFSLSTEDEQLLPDLKVGIERAVHHLRDVRKSIRLASGGVPQYKLPLDALIEDLTELRDRARTELGGE